ncbi:MULTISPECIES: flavin reductase family protein [Kitasatospora]|uniref:flavin reductase family protein n=1 Tax=Kitasatospora TaxID=2063 RepID=UPI000C70BCD5|nr:flavin reductase family protein [Kitasatospora sp. GP30]MDH6139916.1 flavin reductase (DIM6/NTAB) family NADH-FMN oxidoreductase RutF [Kitasatospora sp. GP30]
MSWDQAAATPEAFRSWMSWYPTGVTVVTTADRAGTPYGMTCSSLTSVALEPPTLAVCLRTDALTWRVIERRGAFAVNLLHDDAQRAAELFASPVADRFAEVDWRPSATGLPQLAGEAFGYAECEVAGTAEVGDHTVVLGRVTRLQGGGGFPLLHRHRSYGTWLARPVATAI